MEGNKKLRLAVLGSTKGTDLQAVIDAIEGGRLGVEIVAVVSNNETAFILERAREHGLNAFFLNPKGKSQEEFDVELIALLEKLGTEKAYLFLKKLALTSESGEVRDRADEALFYFDGF